MTTPDAEAPAAFRWCSGGEPSEARRRHLPELLEGLGERFVVCGCAPPWSCDDPEALSPRDEAARRRAHRAKPPRQPVGKHWSSHEVVDYGADLPNIGFRIG